MLYSVVSELKSSAVIAGFCCTVSQLIHQNCFVYARQQMGHRMCCPTMKYGSGSVMLGVVSGEDDLET